MRLKPVTLAAITGAHGVTGEVRLKLFCESAESLRRHKHFNDGALTLAALRATPQGAIARFAEAPDRNAAEALRGTALTVPRDALPPLADGEYYHTDLIGLPVRTPDGAEVGTCIAVENFGAGDVLDIQLPPENGHPGKTFMVPMRPRAVPAWSADGIIVDPAFVV